MTVRLTKKRLERLEYAISLDTILYEKFRRYHEQLSYRERKFAKSQQVAEIFQKKDGMLFNLQILEVQHSADGMRIIVA